MRREPTLADLVLRDWGHDFSAGGRAPPKLSMLRAQRFVFDASASAFMGALLRRTGRLVLREHEFARQPYPQTWIEFDALAYANAIDGEVRNPLAADQRFGYLYDNDTVYLAAANLKGTGFLPLRMHLHQPVGFDEELAMAQRCRCSRLTYRMALIGHVEEDTESPWWGSPEMDAIARSHRLEFPEGMSDDLCSKLLRINQGILKQMLAALLLLTRPGQRVLTTADEAHQRSILRGKNVVLVNHRKVALHLDQSVAMRRFVTGIHTGLHRRLHDVRGHWAQTRRRQQSCEHLWDVVDADHYHCLRCEAKRWWRKAHQRGSNELGSVSHDYEVTQ